MLEFNDGRAVRALPEMALSRMGKILRTVDLAKVLVAQYAGVGGDKDSSTS